MTEPQTDQSPIQMDPESFLRTYVAMTRAAMQNIMDGSMTEDEQEQMEEYHEEMHRVMLTFTDDLSTPHLLFFHLHVVHESMSTALARLLDRQSSFGEEFTRQPSDLPSE